MQVKLGQEVKDKISGFQGIAVARTEYLDGTISIGIAPKVDKDGSLPKQHWADQTYIEVVGNGIL